MILHIVSDEKFIDGAHEVFEKASPGNNEFLNVTDKEDFKILEAIGAWGGKNEIMIITDKEEFKYIKNTPIIRIDIYQFLKKKFAQSLTNYDFVIIHGLFKDEYLQLIMNADDNIKFVWIGWGSDYYEYINNDLYLNKTFNLRQLITISNRTSIKQNIKNYIKKKIYLPAVFDKEKVINRINYFAPVLEEEFFLVKDSLKDFKPKYIDWNYPPPNEFLNAFTSNNRVNGNNILIGNNASFTNNHIEAFERIEKFNIKGRKVIVPLSYGNENYQKEIIQYGQKKFKDNFYPLTDFMSMGDYKKTISSCSIVIMNHLRQQGAGNIIMMLFLGAKIFLNTQNIYYQFLIKNGVIVFSMDELNNKNIDIELTHDQVNINKKILENIYSADQSLNKTIRMIKTVIKNNTSG